MGPNVAAARSRELAAALVRAAGGDRAALRLVYQKTSAKLFGVCLRILKDRSEAEDVLQDVYVTVWRKADSFDPGRASPITWMVAIARNRSIDRLRSRAAGGRFEPIEAADVVSDPAPAALERVEVAQQQQRLARCLEELEARHATAIGAAFLDGATYEQLAARILVLRAEAEIKADALPLGLGHAPLVAAEQRVGAARRCRVGIRMR